MVIGPWTMGDDDKLLLLVVVVSSSSFLVTSAKPTGVIPELSWMILVMKLGA